MQHADAWHLVDGVYQAALDHGFIAPERWSQDGDRPDHFTGFVDLDEDGHLTWDSDLGWTHHTPDSTDTELAEVHADPAEVVLALDLTRN